MASCVLLGRQLLPPLLEIGPAEIGAQQRVAGIEADRELDVAAALLEAAGADLGQPEAEPRQRIGGVERDRALERGSCAVPVRNSTRSAKPRTRLHPRQIGRQRRRPVGGLARAVAIAGHQPQLGQPRPGQRVLGLLRHGLEHRRPGAFEIEVRLLREGQRGLGRGRGRRQLDRLAGVGQGRLALVLDHADDGAQGQRVARPGIGGQRGIEGCAGLVARPTCSSSAAR